MIVNNVLKDVCLAERVSYGAVGFLLLGAVIFAHLSTTNWFPCRILS